jgi:hypothetical protein
MLDAGYHPPKLCVEGGRADRVSSLEHPASDDFRKRALTVDNDPVESTL